MKAKIFLIMLMAFAVTGCSDPESKSTIGALTTVENKPDSISGYAPVNGLKMYYEIHGSGMPLVLIHGGGSTIGTTFGRVLHAFAKTHKVIAVELQAHGRTADRDKPLSFEQDADDVAALLEYLKIDKADIFGFSNGASTTLQFAIRHPEKTNKIVVASTFYKKEGAFPEFWDFMAKATFEGMPQPLKKAYMELNNDSNGLHRMYERDVARMRSFQSISDDQIRKIKSPAFIILGDADVVTPEHAVEMYRMIPNSKLAIFPGGHGDYMGEISAPQDSAVIAATVSMINKFLAK